MQHSFTRWAHNDSPKRLTFHAHESSVVTCLLFSQNRIISASDDHSIQVYSPFTGELLLTLDGHEGGVWALAARKDTLVSGSTDRTVRIWDLTTGRCTHVFGGHTSTVRCLAIVRPEWVDVESESGVVTREKWPKRPLIVTGSRDHSLKVWTLPKSTDAEYRRHVADDAEIDASEVNLFVPPFALWAYHGCRRTWKRIRIINCTWQGMSMLFVLSLLEDVLWFPGAMIAPYESGTSSRGPVNGFSLVTATKVIHDTTKLKASTHTSVVYSVVLDPVRNQACSGSMDGTVRVWNIRNGQCRFTLSGHTSLVGLLGLSSSALVSAAADSTLRIWDPDTGTLRHTLAAHTGAITCFQHDEFKVLSGSDGTLKMWDVRDGTVVRDLLSGVTGMWQVVFEGRWCVAASNQSGRAVLDVWDFGHEDDGEWVGEPAGDLYDDDVDKGQEQ